MLDAPTSVDVMRGSRSVHARASWASVWPRRDAILFNALTFAIAVSVISLGEKELWGKGYGTEAMELLLEIVFDHQGWHHAELWTLAENERAIKSFEKTGFRRVGVEREVAYFSGGYHDVVLMEQLKAEWDARKAS